MVLYAVFNYLTFIYHTSIYSLVILMNMFICVSNAITKGSKKKYDDLYIHGWKDLFVLMCNVKKPRSILVQEMSTFTKKTISLLNEDMKKRGGREKDTKRNSTMRDSP